MFATLKKADPRSKRNISVLVWAQGILGAQLSILIIIGGLAGLYLAENKALATLPISLQMVGNMLSTIPASTLMGRIGRRAGFLIGAVFGACSGALCVYALLEHSFVLLCIGHAIAGVYQAFQAYYRFAAADTASDDVKPVAISLVLAGGLIAAVLGPSIAKISTDMLAPIPFAGAYAAIVLINIIGAIGLIFLDIPPPRQAGYGDAPIRSTGEILRSRPVIAAIICGMVSYALMSLVMTSTPLAMVNCGFEQGHAADVVRWHALAMFAPSFFTGNLIRAYGHRRIILIGLALLAACAGVAVSGVELAHFYSALILLGLGWNFGFIGATSLLATLHAPQERSKVQGINDFCVFGLVATASLASGAMMNAFGWEAVNIAMIPFLLLALGALIWLGRSDEQVIPA